MKVAGIHFRETIARAADQGARAGNLGYRQGAGGSTATCAFGIVGVLEYLDEKFPARSLAARGRAPRTRACLVRNAPAPVAAASAADECRPVLPRQPSPMPKLTCRDRCDLDRLPRFLGSRARFCTARSGRRRDVRAGGLAFHCAVGVIAVARLCACSHGATGLERMARRCAALGSAARRSRLARGQAPVLTDLAASLASSSRRNGRWYSMSFVIATGKAKYAMRSISGKL